MLKTNELLGFMTAALANEILEFIYESDRPTYRAVLNAVAEARHLRGVFLERQSRAQRHATMIATLTRPALNPAAGTLIRTWLVKRHQSMLVDFLNALKIENENGVVEDLPAAVPDDQLKSAVDILLAKYPNEAVAVYLQAFNDMNEAHWPNLEKMLETDARLQLGG